MKKFHRVIISLLLRLYPQNWQDRYKEEFKALLEEHPFSWKIFFNVIFGAVDAHLNYKTGIAWNPRREILKRLIFLALFGLVATWLTWLFTRDILQSFLNLAQSSVNEQKVNGRVSTQFITIDLIGNFSTNIQLALYGGILLSSPFAVYQLLSFFKKKNQAARHETAKSGGTGEVTLNWPGKREKSLLILSVPLLTGFWVAGIIFAYLVLLPGTVRFLVNSSYIINVQIYVGTLGKLVFWTGVIFEIPAFIYLLATSRLVYWKKLRAWWLGVLILSIIVADLMTPSTDLISILTLGLLIFGLYWLGIFAAKLGSKKINYGRGEESAANKSL